MAYPLGPKHNPELRRLYEVEGLKLREIAKRFGVSHQAVHDRLVRMGVAMRTRSNRNHSLEAELLQKLYVRDRLTLAEVAAELKITPYFVARELRRHKIPRRRPGVRRKA